MNILTLKRLYDILVTTEKQSTRQREARSFLISGFKLNTTAQALTRFSAKKGRVVTKLLDALAGGPETSDGAALFRLWAGGSKQCLKTTL